MALLLLTKVELWKSRFGYSSGLQSPTARRVCISRGADFSSANAHLLSPMVPPGRCLLEASRFALGWVSGHRSRSGLSGCGLCQRLDDLAAFNHPNVLPLSVKQNSGYTVELYSGACPSNTADKNVLDRAFISIAFSDMVIASWR